MFLIIIIFPISFCINIFKLEINKIEIRNENFDFSIYLYISRNNFLDAKDISNITLQSDNYTEKNKYITFKCEKHNQTNSNFSKIKCLLNTINCNLKGPFYFRIEDFQKCFTIKKDEIIENYTLNINDEIFSKGMFDIIKRKNSNLFKKFNYKISDITIPIAMAIDDGFVLPTIVSITSIIYNAYSRTTYHFYIMYPPELKKENLNQINELKIKYPKHLFTLFNISNNIFDQGIISDHITKATYFRLLLPELLPNTSKIIYLDGDTLTFCDLKEMYDIDLDDIYCKGFLDILIDPFHPENEIYICAGVLIINLDLFRKDDILNQMVDFMIKNRDKLKYHDQTILNAVCHEKLGILPAKFGVFNEKTEDILLSYPEKYYRYKYKYSKEELNKAYNNPKEIHLNRNKPWFIYGKYVDIWWKYVYKTGYYNLMCEMFTICKEYIDGKIIKVPNKKKNISNVNITIPIAFSFDNNYFYQTMVSIISVILNANNYTHYNFYIMHPPNFSISYKEKMQEIIKKYPKHNFTFFNITTFLFENTKTQSHATLPTYYRLILSNLLPNLNKIIYLEADTLILSDLRELYNINMKGYYYKGFLDIVNYEMIDIFNITNDHSINCGVLLINLDEIRKDDILNKIYNFFKKHKELIEKQNFHVQLLINSVCYKKIGILPAAYGMLNFLMKYLLYENANNYKFKRYNNFELENAYHYPKIMHFVNKPWKDYYVYNKKLWWDYANKTNLKKEMCKTFSACINFSIEEEKKNMEEKKKKEKKRKLISKIKKIISIFVPIIIISIFFLIKKLRRLRANCQIEQFHNLI